MARSPMLSIYAVRATGKWLPFLTVGLGIFSIPLAADEPERKTSSSHAVVVEHASALAPDEKFYGRPCVAVSRTKLEIYDPHSARELAEVKEMGFDRVILDRAPLHRQATEIGLEVVLANWFHAETKPEEIEHSVTVANEVEQSKFAGFSLVDEPELNHPDTPMAYYKELYQRCKSDSTSCLSNAPIEVAIAGPEAEWTVADFDRFSDLYHACDRIRIMSYPHVRERPLRLVYLMLQRSRFAMERCGANVEHCVILQAWVASPEDGLPSIEELRVLAYQAVLGGAEVVSFFEYRPEVWNKSPDFTPRFSQLVQELKWLTGQLAGARIESQMDSEGVLTARALLANGRSMNFRVNTNGTTCRDLQRWSIVSVVD